MRNIILILNLVCIYSMSLFSQAEESKWSYTSGVLLSKSFDGITDSVNALHSIDTDKSFSFGVLGTVDYRILKHWGLSTGILYRYYTNSDANTLKILGRLRYFTKEDPRDGIYLGIGVNESIIHNSSFKVSGEIEVFLGKVFEPESFFPIYLEANFNASLVSANARTKKETTMGGTIDTSYQDIGFKIGIIFD